MLHQSPLGQKTEYVQSYSPEQLFPIPRSMARDKINLSHLLPFKGVDIWTGYELSWLNLKGKPEIATATFTLPCTTPYIVESKSFKLYLNSFNQSKFSSIEEVQETIKKDLSEATQGGVDVQLFPISNRIFEHMEDFKGICVDHLDIEIDEYEVNKELLKADGPIVTETLYSNLLKSNCLATGQPDWGSLLVRYQGKKINHENFLKYVVSFRNHSGFAEHCVEQIYNDILTLCQPTLLTVYARYTRRGGLDINPFRSNFEEAPLNKRQLRQ